MSTTFRYSIHHLKRDNQRVQFQNKQIVETFESNGKTAMITYNLGADGNYISKADRKNAGLHILRRSTKRAGVANGSTSSGKFIVQLPFPQLSKQAAETDTFQEFPTSLMSIRKLQMMATY